MSSFFNAIKNLLTAYHIDKSSTGKIIELCGKMVLKNLFISSDAKPVFKIYRMVAKLSWS